MREKRGWRRSHWVNAWPCLTGWVSNSWQVKTFPALKPIYALIQASLKSALKSTTNLPWRKSLAHWGCSGCLRLCFSAWVCACVRMGALVGKKWVRSPPAFISVMTNHFLNFTISRLFAPLRPLLVRLLQRLSCSAFVSVWNVFNKLSHI